MKYRIDAVDATGDGYGFNIRNERNALIVTFEYADAPQAETAERRSTGGNRKQISSAAANVEEAQAIAEHHHQHVG